MVRVFCLIDRKRITLQMQFADEALRILEKIDLKLNSDAETKVDSSHRVICAGALYSLTLDHARAICNLIKIGVPASAFALQRVAFESCIRGSWIHHCASDEQLERFHKNKGIKETPHTKDIDFETLAQQVERTIGIPAYLSLIKAKSWKALNGYTHNGMHQISRYINKNTITPTFSDDEKYEVIEFSLILSCFSLGGIFDLCKLECSDPELDEILASTVQWKERNQPTYRRR